MLKLTKKADYGIIALVHLAHHRGNPVSCREISDKFCIPFPLLSNVLKTLAHHGIVESIRGVKGGYRLAVDPHQLTLGTLLEALEGPIRLTECMDLPLGISSNCRIEPTCPIRAPVRKLHERFRSLLRGITFAEIARDVCDPNNGGHQIYEVAHLFGQPVHHQG